MSAIILEPDILTPGQIQELIEEAERIINAMSDGSRIARPIGQLVLLYAGVAAVALASLLLSGDQRRPDAMEETALRYRCFTFPLWRHGVLFMPKIVERVPDSISDGLDVLSTALTVVADAWQYSPPEISMEDRYQEIFDNFFRELSAALAGNAHYGKARPGRVTIKGMYRS